MKKIYIFLSLALFWGHAALAGCVESEARSLKAVIEIIHK